MRSAVSSVWVVLLGLLGVLFCAPCKADDSPYPKNRIVYSNLLTARYNPLGLGDEFSLGYRYRLFRNPAPLFKEAHIGIAFDPLITPVSYTAGATITVQPLSIAKLYAGYRFVHRFKLIGVMQSFPSVESDFSDSAREKAEKDNLHYESKGHQFHAGAHLMAKLGPLIISSDTKFVYSDNELREGDTLFYDDVNDMLSADRGWLFTNDTDLLYMFDGAAKGFLAGIRNSASGVFYRDNHYRDGTGKSYDYSDRIGPLLAYVFFDRPGSTFDRPTLILIVNWWLKHRYRTGVDTSQGIPYVVLGFSFEGELFGR